MRKSASCRVYDFIASSLGGFCVGQMSNTLKNKRISLRIKSNRIIRIRHTKRSIRISDLVRIYIPDEIDLRKQEINKTIFSFYKRTINRPIDIINSLEAWFTGRSLNTEWMYDGREILSFFLIVFNRVRDTFSKSILSVFVSPFRKTNLIFIGKMKLVFEKVCHKRVIKYLFLRIMSILKDCLFFSRYHDGSSKIHLHKFTKESISYLGYIILCMEEKIIFLFLKRWNSYIEWITSDRSC